MDYGGWESSDNVAANNRALPGWLKDVFVPILVAAVAFAGTGLGAYFANRSSEEASKNSQEAQNRQLQEDKQEQDRAKRAEVYTHFFDEAFGYGTAMSDGIAACMSQSSGASGSNRELALKSCAWNSYLGNLDSFRRVASARFAVSVFGTDTADKAASDVYDAFPKGNSREQISPPTFDTEIFSNRLVEFLEVACRELPNNPRPGCSR